MKCIKCGEKLEENTKRCPKCGAIIQESLNMENNENTIKNKEEDKESIASEFNRSYEEAQKNTKKKIQITSDEIKDFKLEDLKEKKYVDLATTVSSVGPFALMVLNLIIFKIINNILSLLSLLGPIYIINNALAIFGQLFIVIFIFISLASLVLLIYRSIRYNEKQSIHIIEMISSFISFISLLGFFITKASWLRFFGFISLIFGFDFIIKLFYKKEEIYEPLDYRYDFEVIKKLIIKMKETRALEKEKDAKALQELDTMEIVKADIDGESCFDGKGITLFGYELLSFLVSLITCGLGIPFMKVVIIKWRVSHTIINGKRLTFNGTALQLFGLSIKWFILIVITCGIYGYFAHTDYLKWEIKHTAYEGTPIIESYYRWSIFKGNPFIYLGYSILKDIVIILTCGIGYSWMQCLISRWQIDNTYYNRQKLKLELKGGKAFLTYLINGLLTFLTCGIYGPWATCKINKMIITNTHIEKDM